MAKIENVREMRAFLARLPDDMTFQFLFDGADYRALEFTDCYPNEEGRFIKIEPVEDY